ncbi:NUDIX hydrolase [Haladaptatus paucihalophilus]|nr:NUDIX domain-containing protein [Haladaptatus paucihalophilus]
MSSDRVRPMALGLPHRNDEIFVARLYDTDNDERFYRPIGGGIEFGEYSPAAIVREFDEELDISVKVGDYLGSIENVFSFAGTAGHEVIFIYEIEPTDDLWSVAQLEGHDDGDVTFTGEWKSLSEFDHEDDPLYPDGLLRLIREDTKHVVPRC